MTDEERIVARILDVIPPRSFEVMTFLSLFRVRLSDKTETACVTCGESPELLLNKEFVEAHCTTDEHLFMLVMHELYHVILGHTRLFPRTTEVRNLVFDAVINALLCSLFPDSAFTSFFTDYYPSDKMPFALLRPKGKGTPPEAEEALNLLYGGTDTGTYHDVYEALLKSGCARWPRSCRTGMTARTRCGKLCSVTRSSIERPRGCVVRPAATRGRRSSTSTSRDRLRTRCRPWRRRSCRTA